MTPNDVTALSGRVSAGQRRVRGRRASRRRCVRRPSGVRVPSARARPPRRLVCLVRLVHLVRLVGGLWRIFGIRCRRSSTVGCVVDVEQGTARRRRRGLDGIDRRWQLVGLDLEERAPGRRRCHLASMSNREPPVDPGGSGSCDVEQGAAATRRRGLDVLDRRRFRLRLGSPRRPLWSRPARPARPVRQLPGRGWPTRPSPTPAASARRRAPRPPRGRRRRPARR